LEGKTLRNDWRPKRLKILHLPDLPQPGKPQQAPDELNVVSALKD
jgi:hypothetical protein